MRHDEKLEFWDLIKKSTLHFDLIDVAIIAGIYKDFNRNEIAKQLGLSRVTVWRRLRKIKRILNKRTESVQHF